MKHGRVRKEWRRGDEEAETKKKKGETNSD
jgi:hypothetical protein